MHNYHNYIQLSELNVFDFNSDIISNYLVKDGVHIIYTMTVKKQVWHTKVGGEVSNHHIGLCYVYTYSNCGRAFQ